MTSSRACKFVPRNNKRDKKQEYVRRNRTEPEEKSSAAAAAAPVAAAAAAVQGGSRTRSPSQCASLTGTMYPLLLFTTRHPGTSNSKQQQQQQQLKQGQKRAALVGHEWRVPGWRAPHEDSLHRGRRRRNGAAGARAPPAVTSGNEREDEDAGEALLRHRGQQRHREGGCEGNIKHKSFVRTYLILYERTSHMISCSRAAVVLL